MPETNDERRVRVERVINDVDAVATLYSDISDKLLAILEREEQRITPHLVGLLETEVAHTHEVAIGLFGFSAQLRKLLTETYSNGR